MLRFALKSLSCTVVSSIDDHRQEVMAFCWENGYHGVMADDGEYAMFSPPRLLSAHALKMSFQFTVQTVEYVLDEVAKSLDLNPNRFCLLGALLGNHILPARELRPFHLRLAPELKDGGKLKAGFDKVIRCVVNYIRALAKIDDYERICEDVFGSPDDPRMKRLKASLLYYQSASEEGYSKHRPASAKQAAAATGKKKKGQQSHIKLASELDAESGKVAGGHSTAAAAKDKSKKSKKEKLTSKASTSSAAANDLVERIALDLDKLDLSEALSEAQKVMHQEEDAAAAGAESRETGSPSPSSSSSSAGPTPPPPHAAEDGRREEAAAATSDGDAKGVEGGIAAMSDDQGGAESKAEETPAASEPSDPTLSVVQALASGVEVEPSEDGKVSELKIRFISFQSTT